MDGHFRLPLRCRLIVVEQIPAVDPSDDRRILDRLGLPHPVRPEVETFAFCRVLPPEIHRGELLLLGKDIEFDRSVRKVDPFQPDEPAAIDDLHRRPLRPGLPASPRLPCWPRTRCRPGRRPSPCCL